MAEKDKRATGYTLKIIALITMLIDHIAATVLLRALLAPDQAVFITADSWNTWLVVYRVMRVIGRMAFPLYCFLLVEGFLHSRSVKKYALRLFLFALISEVPFDLAFNQAWWDLSYNNVFFTLLLGLIVIAGIREVNKRIVWKGGSDVKKYLFLLVRFILSSAVLFAGMAVAELVLCTDYGACGVAAIAAIYLLRRYPSVSFGAAVILLALMSSAIELAALLMLIPVSRYNGKRGRKMKYFFYIFYPSHLLLLSGICWLMGLA